MVVDWLVDLDKCSDSLGVGVGVDVRDRVRVRVRVRVTARCLSIMQVGVMVVVCGLNGSMWAMVLVAYCVWGVCASNGVWDARYDIIWRLYNSI